MGEKARLPDKASTVNPKENDSSEPHSVEEDADSSDPEITEIEDVSSEEFDTLNTQLDALATALDDIELKNDNIHAQLLELLQANKLVRQQIQEANESSEEKEGKKKS